jgi:hypothetical protein
MARDYWEQLRKRYQENGVVLVLGAGVSKGSGLPPWEGLLSGLATRHLHEDGAALYRSLTERQFSPQTSVLETETIKFEGIIG